MKAQYRDASLHVQNLSKADGQRMESHRWKLYGYHKQVMEGDCQYAPSSTASNTLKCKWNAWDACKGMSRGDAMESFISLVKEIDPSYKYVEGKTPMTPSGNGGGDMTDKLTDGMASSSSYRTTITKKGYMRKKSEWKKNWDSRYFLLRNGFLRYFLKRGDTDPRMTVAIEKCEVMKRKDSVVIDGKPHYGLTISSSAASVQWNLMLDSRDDRDDWVETLQEAKGISIAGDSGEYNSRSSMNGSNSSGSNVNSNNNTSVKPSDKDNSMVFDSCTENIPRVFLKSLEKNVTELLSAADTKDGWEDLFTKDLGTGQSMHAYRKPGDTILVKGQAAIPFSIKDIFSLISDLNQLPLINPQVDAVQKLKNFSATTSTNHIVFKQVWPTAVRDMINFTHWRIVSGGKVVIVTYNAEDYHAADQLESLPPPKGAVRANLVLGGYVLAPDLKSGTTKVTYLVSSDLRGSIPSRVGNLVARGQPLIVAAIAKHLNSLDPSTLSSPKEIPTYDDLCNIVMAANREATFGFYKAPKAGEKQNSSVKNNLQNSNTANDDMKKQRMQKSFSFEPMFYTLLLPFLLAYVLDDHKILGFLVGLAICLPYVHNQMLQGEAIGDSKYPNNVEFSNALPKGRVLVQFSVDLGKLLRYVEGKREEYGMDITLTHVVAKAAASALNQCQDLNGRIIGNVFYRNRSQSVDISVSADYSDMIAIKIDDAESKTLNTIADELQAKSRSVRRALTTGAGAGGGEKASAGTKVLGGGPSSRLGILLDAVPFFVSYGVRYTLRLFASYYGMTFPALGITPFPHGACNIIATPRDTSCAEGLELDVGVIMVPETDATISSPPVVITIGGISLKTTIEQEMGDKKVSAAPVLNLAVSVDSRAVGFARGRQFASILQEFMMNYSDE